MDIIKKVGGIDFTTQIDIFIIITIFQPFFVLLGKKFTILYIGVPFILIISGLKNKMSLELKTKLNMVLLFFLLSLFISLLNSRSYSSSSIWISIWVIYILIYFWVANYEEAINMNRIISTNLISGIIVGGVGILQYIFIQVFNGWYHFKIYILDNFIGNMIYSKNTAQNVLIDPGNWFNYTTGAPNFRATSIFGGPSGNGMFSAYILILALTCGLFNKKAKRVSIAAIIVSTVNLLLTFGRSSWVNIFCALITLVFLSLKNTQLKIKINKNIIIKVLTACVIVLVFVILFDKMLINKVSKVFLSIFDISEMSNNGRIMIWLQNFQLFINHPFIGYGIGNYNIAYSEFFSKTSSLIPFTAHNAYMLFLVETGFLGFISFAMLIIYPIIMANISIRKSINNNNKSFLIFFVASMIGIMIQFFFDYDFNNTRFIPLLFINMAIVYRIYSKKGVEWNE